MQTPKASRTCDVPEVSASGYFEHWRRKDTTEPSKPGVHKRISDEALEQRAKGVQIRPFKVAASNSVFALAGTLV